MVEVNVCYLLEVNSKFRFVNHFTVLCTHDDRSFILCLEKQIVYITIHCISLTFFLLLAIHG